MRTIALDWETFYDKVCSVKTLGNWAYTHHPDFQAYMVSVYDGNESWAGHPRELNWDALDGARLLSHNAAFDANVYIAEAERGNVPWINIPEWHCTANMTVALSGHRDLKRSSEHMLGAAELSRLIGSEHVSKSVRGSAEGLRYEDFLREPGRWDEMKAYAVHDAILCWHLWDRFSCRYSDLERLMSGLTIKWAVDGVGVNWDLVEHYECVVNDAMVQARAGLPWVVEGKAETSSIAIKDHCAACGIPVPPVKEDDEKGYDAWVELHREKYPWVYLISEFRKLNKMANFFRKLRERRRPDDTIESTLLYFGGHTGRWAGALGEKDSKGINLQNLRKKPLLVDGVEVHQRHVFVPRSRATNKFIVADYSQIEPRVLNWLAGNQELLDLIEKKGMNIYEAHARMTMGWTGGDLKATAETDKTAAGIYSLAKARVLMLGYGAGWKKFKDTAYDYIKRVLTDDEALKTVLDFRKTNPLITQFWRDRDVELHEASRRTHPANILVQKLRSGREMVYTNVISKMVPAMVPDYQKDPSGKTLKAILSSQCTAMVSGWKVRHFYGGKITENIVQATARDIFAEGLRKVHEKGWSAPFHVHDEVILDVDKSVTVEEAVATLSYQPEWAVGCPVGVDAHETDHYLKK